MNLHFFLPRFCRVIHADFSLGMTHKLFVGQTATYDVL